MVCEALQTCGVSSSESHEKGILQMKNLKLRETQGLSQSHSASKWQERNWIPRSSNLESSFVPEITLFTLCHVHLFFMDICLVTEKFMFKVGQIFLVGRIV